MGDLINTEQWRIVIHESEEGGYWGEVPAMPGCASEGATIEECRANVIEAARGCLSAYLEMAIKRLVAITKGRSSNELSRMYSRAMLFYACSCLWL